MSLRWLSVELTPSYLLDPSFLLDEVEFRETFRGYDRNQVDTFLEQLAGAVGELQERIGAAEARAQAAERRAGDTRGDEASRTLLLAQRTADTALREARDEAARLVREAAGEADRQGQDRRNQLVAEIDALDVTRQERVTEIDRLDGQLEAQRARLRSVVQDLQRLLDDDPEAVAESDRAEAAAPTPPVADPTAEPGGPDEADDEIRLDLRRVLDPELSASEDPAEAQATADQGVDDADRAAPDIGDAEDERIVDLRQHWEPPPPPRPRPRFGRQREGW